MTDRVDLAAFDVALDALARVISERLGQRYPEARLAELDPLDRRHALSNIVADYNNGDTHAGAVPTGASSVPVQVVTDAEEFFRSANSPVEAGQRDERATLLGAFDAAIELLEAKLR